MDPFEQLKRDVDRLARALGHAIRSVSGDRLYELEEKVRGLTKQLRQDPHNAEADQELRHTVTSLTDEEAQGLSRAFAIYFHLVNLAEERHRVRMNELRELDSTVAKPRNESLLSLVLKLQQRGFDADVSEKLLKTLQLDLTFTAHPTESRRLTVRYHLATIERLLGTDAGSDELLQAHVSLLWATEELQRTRPTVQDEVKAGLSYLPTTVWEAIPRLSFALSKAFETVYGRRPTLPAPVSFHSWIGGDRDGNRSVNPEVTAWSQRWAQNTLLHRYVETIDELIRALSAASSRAELPESLSTRGEETLAPFRVDDGQFEGEPLRRLLMGMRAKTRVLLGERDDGPGYSDPKEWEADLEALSQALHGAGLGEAARALVGPLQARARVFGLALVQLDVREESSEHEVAVAELLKVAGVCNDYAALSVKEKDRLLSAELASARALAPVGYEPESRQLLVALDALRAWRSRGAYVISMARDATDALEVLILAREVGLYRPGEPLPFDVSPLFETLGDLDAAPEVVTSLLRNPVFRAHVDGRGALEVMIGYSDSNKDAGFLAASWALARAQHGIARAARSEGVRVSFFHGRGSSTARGGGPAGRAVISLPEGTVGPRMRLTEQGEALADHYAHSSLAFRHLEQLVHHLGLAAARDSQPSIEDYFDSEPERIAVLDACAARSAEKYRALLHTPRFFEFFEQFTPLREIASLKIASRPVYRHGRVRDVNDLRAIPWVMSWTQVRANVPGWYGLGTGLETMDVDARRRLYREWPLFRSTLDSAAMSLAKGDLGIAGQYARLVEPELASTFLTLIRDEWRLTQSLLEETFEGSLLWASPTLDRSIALRNPYVDPINHVQIEVLARWRAMPEDDPNRSSTESALLTTLLGIAAGLRNTG